MRLVFITKCDSFITKCDSYYKSDDFTTKCDSYYKIQRLLQTAIVQEYLLLCLQL